MSRLLAFDLDDVLVVTDTCVRLSNGERISTSEFRDRRPRANLAEDAFLEFAREPALLREGPCAQLLRGAGVPLECLAVVTARSAPSSLIAAFIGRRMAVDLDARNVYCVNSEDFSRRFRVDPGSLSTAELKVLALRDFLSRFPGRASLVYYDDDEDNVLKIREAFVSERDVSVVHVA
jgi:hypothetical protein